MSEISKDDLLLQECYLDLCDDFIERLPDWVLYQPKYTPEELIVHDERILTKLHDIVPQFSNTRPLAFELLKIVGHMNTKAGEISLCKLILENHLHGPIHDRISEALSDRLTDVESTPSLLAEEFGAAQQQYVSAPQRQQDESDFDQSAPMPL